MNKHRILITRATFDEVVTDLRRNFDVEMGGDDPCLPEELRRRAARADVLMVWGDRIDAALLDAAGVGDDVSVDDFRRYGSGRQLYNFHVDNAAAY